MHAFLSDDLWQAIPENQVAATKGTAGRAAIVGDLWADDKLRKRNKGLEIQVKTLKLKLADAQRGIWEINERAAPAPPSRPPAPPSRPRLSHWTGVAAAPPPSVEAAERPVACMMSGASRTLHVPELQRALTQHFPLEACDLHLHLTATDVRDDRGGNRAPPLARLLQLSSALGATTFSIYNKSTCENRSAAAELECCAPARVRAAAASPTTHRMEGDTPFERQMHAHGLLQYYHVRQAWRQTLQYERKRRRRPYELVVRLRPDLLFFERIPLSHLLDLPRDRIAVMRKWRDMFADWFYVCPRSLADAFFGETLIGAMGSWATWRGAPGPRPTSPPWWKSALPPHYPARGQSWSCLNGTAHHHPEFGWTLALRGLLPEPGRSNPRLVRGYFDATALFPVAILRGDAKTVPRHLDCEGMVFWSAALRRRCEQVSSQLSLRRQANQQIRHGGG
jgi:hypothetical protein